MRVIFCVFIGQLDMLLYEVPNQIFCPFFCCAVSLSVFIIVLYIFWIWVIQSFTPWFVFSLSFSYLLMNRSPSLLLKVTNTYGDYQLLDTVQCILHRITLLILIMTLLAIREIPLALFLRWGNWVKETLSNLLKVTHLVSGGVRQIRISKMILKRRTKRGGFSLIKQRYLSSSG